MNLHVLVFTCLFAVVTPQLNFNIRAEFFNVDGDGGDAWFDFCGFNCQAIGASVPPTGLGNFCDSSCRYRFRCKTPLGSLCLWHESQYNNICYGNTCPSGFNSGYYSAVQLRWGKTSTSVASAMSGLGFNPKPGPIQIRKEFVLGDMTHYNFPISSGSGVKAFSFRVFFSLPSIGVADKVFEYRMKVDETDNSKRQRGCGGDCPYNSRVPGAACNIGCPDQISVPNGVSTTVFQYNGVSYTLVISGFRQSGQLSTLTGFISDEGLSITANMYAIVTEACPQCATGRIPFFDFNTLRCSCPCPSTPCQTTQLIKAPDCQCVCPSNFCGLDGAQATVTGAGTCDCGTCKTGNCPPFRVPFRTPTGLCGCQCQNNCQRGGTPNPNSPTCACQNCPACPANFNNDQNCNCVCGITAASCTSAQNFQDCSCKCKFLCPAGQWGSQVPGSCNCPCDVAALTARCNGLKRSTKYFEFNPLNGQGGSCDCGDCLPNYTPGAKGACECKLKCGGQFQLDAANCKCVCPTGAPKCSFPNVTDVVNCDCKACSFPTQCDALCQPVATQCAAQHRALDFSATKCACGACLNKYQEDPITKQCVCPVNNASGYCGAGTQFSLNNADCKCVCPPGGPVCSYPKVANASSCSCRDCNYEAECRTLCTPTFALCQARNRSTLFDAKTCACGPCLNRNDDQDGKDVTCSCRLTAEKCGPLPNFFTVTPDCNCACPVFNCSYPFFVNRTSCSCQRCKYETGECGQLCPNINTTCAALNRVPILTADFCGCGACINNFTGPNDTSKICGNCSLSNSICQATFRPINSSFVGQATVDTTTCRCQCPPGAVNKCSPPLFFDADTCACSPCVESANRSCTCDVNVTYCASKNRDRLFTSTQCRCGNCINRFKSAQKRGVLEDYNSTCICTLTQSDVGCGSQSLVFTDNCTCVCPPGKPDCKYPEFRDPDLNTCGCKTCNYDKGECVCNKENECIAANRKYIHNATVCSCGPCIGNFVEDPITKTCVCPLTSNSTICGGPGSKSVVNPVTCNCSCPAGEPRCVYPEIVDPSKLCNCKKCDPATECGPACRKNCTGLFRNLIQTPDECTCGSCINNYTLPNGADENATCVCLLTKEKCGIDSQFTVDNSSCKCVCPVGGPVCNSYPFITVDNAKCSCQRCNFTGNGCICDPSVRTRCESLNRQYVFDANKCGCGTCINNFTDNDTVNFSTNCTQCDLTDQSCRPEPGSLKVINKATCSCQCPPNPVCDSSNGTMIYNASTCSCRPCVIGECQCGNGIVEPGEDCDDNSACCEGCKFIAEGQPCRTNKCGVCSKPLNSTATCVDNTKSLCPSTDCTSNTCVQSSAINGTVTTYSYVCNETNLADETACGDKNLCLRSCKLGKCTNFTSEELENRCTPEQALNANCTACCDYKCVPATGKCQASYEGRLNTTCDDSDPCTDADVCVPSNSSKPLVCQGNALCTDARRGVPPPCFENYCVLGFCKTRVTNVNGTCPASGYCTLPGVCSPTGDCVRPPVICASPNPCTVGRCYESRKGCVNNTELANGSPCDDGDNCTINDRCVNGTCRGSNNCNTTDSGGPNLAVPLGVTGAVVATGAAAAAFFIYKSVAASGLVDPATWGEAASSQFDSNPLFEGKTQFGENMLYQAK